MRKPLTILAVAVLLGSPLSAAYVVVLKDGTRYKAQAKWTMQGSKALIKLENGQQLTIDPSMIDAEKSEQATRLGYGSANVMAEDTAQTQTAAPQAKQPSLGSSVRLRGRGAFGGTTTDTASQATTPNPATSTEAVPDQLDTRLKDKFERAYENVGIFEHKLVGTNRNVRAELTADNEDKVFNALSATAFLVVRNAGVDGVQIDMVEVFLKTTTGGAAGRFQMSRADAEAINGKTMGLPEYFVRKVVY